MAHSLPHPPLLEAHSARYHPHRLRDGIHPDVQMIHERIEAINYLDSITKNHTPSVAFAITLVCKNSVFDYSKSYVFQKME